MGSVSMSKTPQVRIGDAERQAAGRRLEQHYAEGRLSWEELDERLAKAYTARVEDELTPLFADLPALPPPPPPAPTARSRAGKLAERASRHDIRALIIWTAMTAAIIGVLHWEFVPIVFIWAFMVFGQRARHGHPGHRYGRHHGH